MYWSREDKQAFFAICITMLTICSLGFLGAWHSEVEGFFHELLKIVMLFVLGAGFVVHFLVMGGIYIWKEFIE